MQNRTCSSAKGAFQSKQTQSKIKVVFNVFKDMDDEIYENYSDNIKRLKQAIDNADAILIGAGAGTICISWLHL